MALRVGAAQIRACQQVECGVQLEWVSGALRLVSPDPGLCLAALTEVVVNTSTSECRTCQISSFANLLLIVSLIKNC